MAQTTEINDLFPDTLPKPVPKPELTPTDKAKAAAKAATQSPKEKLPVDKDRLVCYAGHQILETDRTLSLEQIRQKLELEYPELSSGRCQMAYDEKTGIVSVMPTAAKKGGH